MHGGKLQTLLVAAQFSHAGLKADAVCKTSLLTIAPKAKLPRNNVAETV